MIADWEPDPDAELVDGCRVRIGDGPHEGTWEDYDNNQVYLGGVSTGNHWHVAVPLGCPVTVLRAVQSERAWQPGDVVRDANGDVGVRTEGCWLQAGAVGEHADGYLVRPLTLLVPATPDADR